MSTLPGNFKSFVYTLFMDADNNKLTIKDLYKTTLCLLWFFFLFSPQIIFSIIGVFWSNFIIIDFVDYPYLNPPIFFSIGEAISSIAILITIYQFKRDDWLISLRVRKYVEPTILVTIISGLLLTIFSSFVVIENPVYIFQTSIFYQVLGSILILFSIVFLFLKSTNKNLFNKNTDGRFYEVMVSELSRPTPERLDVALEAFLDNFNNICKAASQNVESEIRNGAIAILDVLLGESTFVDIITTKRLDALHHILLTLEKYNLDSTRARGFSNIVKNLFNDKTSFLYKHLEMNGLALSSNLYRLLFESPKIINNFNLFGWPAIDHTMRKDMDQIQLNVFIKALSKSIETYLKSGQVQPIRINSGLEHLSDIFKDICLEISTEESRGVDTKYVMKDKWWMLYTIANFIGHDYVFLAYKETLNSNVVEREKTAAEANFNSYLTINDAIAGVLYKSLLSLSYIKDSNHIYHLVLELLHGMIYEDKYKQGYRTPFEKRVWEQIANNVINRHYPAILKSYLTTIGFSLASKDINETGWIGEQTEKMRRLLYVDLKPLLDKSEKMVNGALMQDILLPTSMEYKDKKFSYIMGFGEGEKVEIAEPPVGSASALIGIDPNKVSSL